MNARIKISRSKSDFLSDRIRQCSSDSTLLGFAELLIKVMDADIEKICGVIGAITRIPADAQLGVLTWLRTKPKIAAACAFLKQADFDETVDSIKVEDNIIGDIALKSRDHKIKIKARCLAPLSHESDEKAGNATLFRRMGVLCEGEFKRDLKRFFANVGKKRSIGLGTVVDITVGRIDDDYSLVRDGLAMTWLPDPDGWRVCRTRPPFWNIVNAVTVCEIGDPYDKI